MPVSNRDQTPDEEAIGQLLNSLQAILAYLRNPSRNKLIVSYSFKRLLDVVHNKVILFIYYLTNCLYSVAAASIQGDHYTYYLVYFFITVVGLLFEGVVITADILKLKNHSSRIRGESIPPGATEHRNYYRKAKDVFIDCVLLSLGELLIYPILICNLYGFINETAWQFNDVISGLNFLLFLYSLLMDFVFTKNLVIHLVKTIIKATYATHTQYYVSVQPSKPLKSKKSYHLILPFATATALTHWTMIGIIAVRIHFDNFTTEKDNVDGDSLNTGIYRMTPFTGYMIGFALCVPIFSSAVFALLNKLWFYELYTVIHRSTRCRCKNHTHVFESKTLKLSWSIKLFAFIRDPKAIPAVIVLMTLFIIFSIGAYLPDYDDSHYADAKYFIEGLGASFIILFLVSNIQAALIFVIMLLTITTMLLCVLYVVCACLHTCHNDHYVIILT